MKQVFEKLTVMVAAVTVFVSCSKDDNNGNGNGVPGPQRYSIAKAHWLRYKRKLFYQETTS